MADSLLTIAEVAKLTSQSVETLKKHCQAGLIPGAVKKGKTWLIPESIIPTPTRPKAGVYVDGANVFHGGLEAGWLLDYQKVIQFVKRQYDPVILSYYDSVGYEKDTSGNLVRDENGKFIPKVGQIAFHNVLTGMGFRVVSKPLKFIDGDPQKPKNNMDSYLTLDVAKELDQWDSLLLFSGDSDFDRLVDDLITVGKQVKVFSFRKRLSYELRVKGFKSPLVTTTELEELESVLSHDRRAR